MGTEQASETLILDNKWRHWLPEKTLVCSPLKFQLLNVEFCSFILPRSTLTVWTQFHMPIIQRNAHTLSCWQHHLTVNSNAKYSDNRVSDITCCTADTGQAINNEQIGDHVERNSLRQDMTFRRGTVDNSDRIVALHSVCERESTRYQPNYWGCAGATACHVWSVVLLLSWVYCRSCARCTAAIIVSVL
jgi:hypothetical protein